MAAERLTLDRKERQELAEFLTGHEGSWGNISEDDARRVADACDAFLCIQYLLQMRRAPQPRRPRRTTVRT